MELELDLCSNDECLRYTNKKMKRIKIFISSVQSEFAEERAMLCHYIRTDVLLGIGMVILKRWVQEQKTSLTSAANMV